MRAQTIVLSETVVDVGGHRLPTGEFAFDLPLSVVTWRVRSLTSGPPRVMTTGMWTSGVCFQSVGFTVAR
ncbi:MAG: hypothetical protein VYE68_09630 [Acidobacteriota bacterium]|nr:hypothetical protein [Acidobacteriota bacterium]